MGMKPWQRLKRALLVLGTSSVPLAATRAASAAINIATVSVGNPGNAADPIGLGSVPYNYSIGTYDVTSSQYTVFLNAVAASDPYGVYYPGMAGTTTGNPGIIQNGSPGSYSYTVIDGRGDNPVTDVNFWDATRFANWLENGQPIGPEGPGTTETGTYTLTPTGMTNNTVTRNANSTWAVESLNEWYKAAYYSPTLNNGAGGYWMYPTQSNTVSISQADYDSDDTTPVGSYPYPSYYGTYDEGGNVWQMNDKINNTSRGIEGGAFEWDASFFELGDIGVGGPEGNHDDTGFRLVNLAVPEPASMGLLVLGAMCVSGRRRGVKK
jgi:formylglycine-generating enzyme required for sulfatase activity